MTDAATVVLVHGAWHGAWCWEKVRPRLDDFGIATVAVDLPFTSQPDDVAAVRGALDRIGGRVVLCGHSYGGSVITDAGRHPNVERLLYICAFACDEGESPAATAPDTPMPTTNLADALDVVDGLATVKPDAVINTFYHDCDPADAEAAKARLRPTAFECFIAAVGAPAWRAKPSTFAVCREDRAIHPELQRLMAKRCTESVEWPTAHSPFVNRPDLVVDTLAELAR